jgi:CRISPR-associated protein Cmr4
MNSSPDRTTPLTKVLYLFTRTPLHVGAGGSVGALDQPIQRERHTGFPIIPGSSIKGVLADGYLQRNADGSLGKDEKGHSYRTADGRSIFGDERPDHANASSGSVSFGEAKLLAFPVRSAKGSFALATSPLALQRFARDAQLNVPVPPAPPDMSCLAGNRIIIDRNGQKGVVLEEYKFSVVGSFPVEWERVLCSSLNDAVLAGAGGRFVLLSDGDLSHFAVSSCQVSQHVRISDETGTAEDGGLFDEETVPSETLFYSTLTVVRAGMEQNAVFSSLAREQLIQFGGSGTSGLGFCTVKLQ